MKKSKYFATIAFMIFGTLFYGCRPSAREVAGVISKIPLGTSRVEVRKIIFNAYSKKYRDNASKQGYMLDEPPRPVTESALKAEKDLIKVLRMGGHYVYLYPSNLFDNLSDKCFVDGIGLVAETSEGNGSVTIYYDGCTNYIGFIAESEFEKESHN